MIRILGSFLLLNMIAALSSCGRGVPELSVWLDSMPDRPDPHFAESDADFMLVSSLFEGLIIRDPGTSEILPGLASSWEAGPDGHSVLFHLRAAHWSDGRPVSALHVVESWQRLLDPRTASPLAWIPAELLAGGEKALFGKIPLDDVGLEAIDDRTLLITPLVSTDTLLQALAHPALSVLPTHLTEGSMGSWLEPEGFTGAGPFLLKGWGVKTGIHIESNPDYWNSGNVALNRVRFVFHGTRNAEGFEFRPHDADWERGGEPGVEEGWRYSPRPAVDLFLFPCENPPFNDPRVRRAFSLSIDRRLLVSEIRTGTPAYGLVPPLPNFAGSNQEEFDPEAARGLLAEAGYPEGRGFPVIGLIFNSSPRHREVATFLQTQWRSHLNLTCRLEEQASFEPRTFTGRESALLRVGFLPPISDPGYYLRIFHRQHPANLGNYSNDEFDDLLISGNPEKKTERLKLAEILLIRQDQGVLPLYYHGTWHRLDESRWEGWQANPLDWHPLSSIRPVMKESKICFPRPWPQAIPPLRDQIHSDVECGR